MVAKDKKKNKEEMEEQDMDKGEAGGQASYERDEFETEDIGSEVDETDVLGEDKT